MPKWTIFLFLSAPLQAEDLPTLGLGNITGADYNFNVYKKNQDWITDAKKKNIELNVWTVNNKEDMQWFINNKFDYITTNEPELLLELMNK